MLVFSGTKKPSDSYSNLFDQFDYMDLLIDVFLCSFLRSKDNSVINVDHEAVYQVIGSR